MNDSHAQQHTEDASIAISRHLAETRYEDLPAPVVAAVKASILDSIGCAIAGTSGPDIAAIHALVRTWGGHAASTVVGGGGLRVPAYNAVLANAALVHQDDFDDTYDPSPCHPSSASLMPALALGQERGGATGRDIITAVALANDLIVRMANAITGRMDAYPWFRAPVLGIFAATAASAKLLGADAGQHLNALGLTLPQTGGTWASVHHPGSSVRAIRDGLAYKNSVLAAQLAMGGVRGDAELLDGPFGFYHAFFRAEYDRSRLLDGLGETFLADRISLKPWPSCRHLHATLTAVVGLMETHDLAFADISQVVVRVGDINLTRCQTVTTGMIPAQRIDLLCNLPFAVGAAILHRGLPLRLYRDPAMADAVVRDAVPKVTWVHDPAQNGDWSLEPGRVEIRTTAGAVLSAYAPLGLGHPDHRMSEDRLRAKFMDCIGAGARKLAPGTAERIVEQVLRLEDAPEIETLMSLLQ
jgi:2-methylcitrate dehydratase PrpD